MKVSELQVGSFLDDYRRDKRILITRISEWSGGGNGDIDFTEMRVFGARGERAMGVKKRQMTFRQFEKLKYLRIAETEPPELEADLPDASVWENPPAPARARPLISRDDVDSLREARACVERKLCWYDARNKDAPAKTLRAARWLDELIASAERMVNR